MGTLTAAAARARLENLLQWGQAPALTVVEVDDLFAMLPKVKDSVGRLPADAGYVATYSDAPYAFRTAVAQGWLWKAGKVAGQYQVATGTGTSFQRQQQHEMCLAQAARYGAGGGTLGSSATFTANSKKVSS